MKHTLFLLACAAMIGAIPAAETEPAPAKSPEALELLHRSDDFAP